MSHDRRAHRVCTALVFALTCGCASDRELRDPRTIETLSVTIENDWFAASDDGYTNGIGVTWVSGAANATEPDSLTRKWVDAMSFLPFVDTESDETYASFTVGQEMYTPSDITLFNPPLDDQPYAGVLFLDLGLYTKREESRHSWKLRLGVVGPASQTDHVQIAIHDLIDDDDPAGWRAQLPNEPVVNLDYTYSPEWLGEDDGEDGDFSWQVAPTTNLSAGTFFTGASANLIGELGWNARDTVGLTSLRRGVQAIDSMNSGRQKRTAFSLFAGFGGFAVAHFLPLDGTVFRDSRSVESEPLVGFVTGGARLSRGGFSVGYQLTGFTDTFEGQTSSSDFGAMTFTFSL